MNRTDTPTAPGTPATARTPVRPGTAALAAAAAGMALALTCGGCNFLGTLSYINYAFIDPMIPEPEVKAQYELPKGRVAVLVEGQGDLDLNAPQLPEMVADRLVTELRKNLKGGVRVVPQEDVEGLRRGMTRRRFDRMGPVELGNRLRADSIIRVEIHDYQRAISSEPGARMNSLKVTVRVEDAAEDGRRLWPESETFHTFNVQCGRFNPMVEEEYHNRSLARIADLTAENISKLFYTYRPPKRDIGDAPP
jgi:hypothetical protein